VKRVPQTCVGIPQCIQVIIRIRDAIYIPYSTLFMHAIFLIVLKMRSFLPTAFRLWPGFRFWVQRPLFEYPLFRASMISKSRSLNVPRGTYYLMKIPKIDPLPWIRVQSLDWDAKIYREPNKSVEALCREGNLIDLMIFSKKHNLDGTRAFLKSCRWGHLAMAQWLRLRYPISKDSIRKAFYRSCKHGQLAVAQWLYLDLNETDLQYGFRKACLNDQLEIVTWLINYVSMDYLAFRVATKQGYYDLVKIMLQSWPHLDVHNCNDFAFKVCLKYKPFGKMNIERVRCSFF
jgi:hypothetical protein